MKKLFINKQLSFKKAGLLGLLCCLMLMSSVYAQDDSAAVAPVKKTRSYVKNTFDGNYLIDNQTVVVPIKGTFEFDIQHRFGTVNHGIKDLFGIFASANMLLGFSYTPVKNLQVGFGATNDRMQVDGNVKYALLRQTKDNVFPVSVTYFGNVVVDTRAKSNSLPIVDFSDRLSFFNQIIIARKVTEKFSAQIAPSLSYYNNIEAYVDKDGNIQPKMKHAHFALSFSGRYKLTKTMSFIANYDQPLTQHPMNNPHPNISFGLDIKTSGHDFQVFAGNYGYILPQNNHTGNQNDYTKGQFLIGFNISRLWNF